MQRGDVVGGRYRLTEPLASGGMGTVWRARHVELDVDVAVKVMSPALVSAPTALARFQREARAAAQLRSPHVVRVFDYGVHQEQPYLAMDLLVGEDLRTHLERHGPLPLGRVAHILDALAKALRVAHAAGIVHRDLKPANVFLERSGDDEIVKILDFGIAKDLAGSAVDGLKTSTSTVVGSPLYMSPEQVRGAEVDHRTDLWSLATLTFEMATGRQPFEGASLGDVFARIVADTIPAPSSVLPGLPAALDAFFERAFARSPDARFASATDLAAAFRAALGDQALAMTRVRAPASVARPDAPTLGIGPDEAVPRARAAVATSDDAMAPTERGDATSAERVDPPTSAGALTAPRATSDDELALMRTVETDTGPPGERSPARRRPWVALVGAALVAALGVAGVLLAGRDAPPPLSASGEPAASGASDAPAPPDVAPSAAVVEAPASSASPPSSGSARSATAPAASPTSLAASALPLAASSGTAPPAPSPASRPPTSRSATPPPPPATPSAPVAIDPIFGVPVGGP